MKRAVLAPAIAAFAVSTLAATALATALAGCSSQSAYSQSDAERYIRQSESQWAESVATNEASVVKRILADDFVWVMPDGSVWNKAQTVADAERGPGGFTSDHLNYVNIRFFGTTAVAQGSETWHRSTGHQRVGRFVWADTWVLRNGLWQIVQAEDLIAPVPGRSSH